MKNSLIKISDKWEIIRDEFYEIDPLDSSTDDERKFNDLFCQEDLLLLKISDFKLDLGWYGKEKEGHFGLYFYRGTNWHNCQLLEKRITNNYCEIIELINELIEKVDSKNYDIKEIKYSSIDEYTDSQYVSIFLKK